MRLEGDGKRRFSMGVAHPQGGGDHGAVAQMDAIKIAHGDHGAPGDPGGRGVVSDNGKIGVISGIFGIPGFGNAAGP